MSMQDPISDMIVRVKNAQSRGHKEVLLDASKIKFGICKVLESEGYIKKVELVGEQPKHCLLYTSPSPRDGLLSRMPSSA